MCQFSPLERVLANISEDKICFHSFAIELRIFSPLTSFKVPKSDNQASNSLWWSTLALYELVGLRRSFHLKSHGNKSLSRSRMIASPEIQCNQFESSRLSSGKGGKCQRDSKGGLGRRNFNGKIETPEWIKPRKEDISRSSHPNSRRVRLMQTAQVLIHTGLDTTTYVCYGALSTSNYNIYWV